MMVVQIMMCVNVGGDIVVVVVVVAGANCDRGGYRAVQTTSPHRFALRTALERIGCTGRITWNRNVDISYFILTFILIKNFPNILNIFH